MVRPYCQPRPSARPQHPEDDLVGPFQICDSMILSESTFFHFKRQQQLGHEGRSPHPFFTFWKSLGVVFMQDKSSKNTLRKTLETSRKILPVEDWWMKVLERAEMDKPTILIKEKWVNIFINDWKSMISCRRKRKMICRFED